MRWIKNISLLSISFFFTTFCVSNLHAQIEVNDGLSASEMAEAIAGPGIQVFNPVLNGASVSYGSYSTENTSLPFGNGILLTTGKASYAIGPNNVQHRSYINSNPGSPLLDSNLNQTTNDACSFEFDIIPQGDTLRFNFTFASEEYHNFVGSIYSDVFAFYISGPGINGYENLALVPESNDPVSINTINSVFNSAYFADNDNPAGSDLQYNGYTIGLEAKRQVNPCDTYHLILVIADANDYSIDSGVFIEKIESSNASLSSATAGGIEYMVEGCNDGTINFSRLSEDQSEDITITYYVDGTAINGVDYLPQIGSDPDPSVPKTIDILAGSDNASINISPVDDDMLNDNKYVAIYLASTTCPEIIYDSLIFPIFDSLIVQSSPDTAICFGEEFTLNTIAGGSAWTWSPSESVQNPSAESTLAFPDSTTEYILYSTASFCEGYDTTLVRVSRLQLAIDSVIPSCYGVESGSILSNPSGGIEPYQITWNGPNGFISNSFNLNNLESGTYSYTLLDSILCSINGEIQIQSNEELIVDLFAPTIAPSNYHISCNGDSSGSIFSTVSGGTIPYQFIWAPGGQNSNNLINQPAGNYSLLVIDGLGCIAIDTISLQEPDPLYLNLDSIKDISCYGESNGYLEVSASGGAAPYIYQWNTNPPTNSNSLTNLSVGNYTISVFDQVSCQIDSSFQLSEPVSELSLNIDTVIHVECPSDADGAIDITVTGGTAPYTYSWNTIPVQTTENIEFLDPGVYTLLYSDSAGCQNTEQIEVELLNQELNASVSSQSNVNCYGEATGSAAISVSGGTGNYTYLWTPGNYTTSNVFNLSAGNYNVLINDTGACALSFNLPVIITEPSDSIEIQLTGSDFNGFGLSCFESGDASINTTITGGNPPYSFSWQLNGSFFSANQNLSNLQAGNYTLNASDQNGCSVIDSIVLTQPDEIDIDFVMTPASCPTPGSNDGSINVTVISGQVPFQFAWSGPSGFTSNQQNITSLEAGVYYLEITDGLFCKNDFSITVTQPDNFIVDELLSSYPGLWNVDCFGANSGRIDVSVSNAASPITFSWLFEGFEIATDTFISNAFAGDYELIITDANNCIENRFYTLVQPDSIIIDFDANADSYGNSISCYSGSDGVLSATITGGTPAYSYTWTYPDNSNSSDNPINDLSAGTYTLQVEDLNSCLGNDSIDIFQPDSIEITLSSPTFNGFNVTCFNGNDGSIITELIGGTPPYSFQWIYPGGGVGSTDQNPANLQAGTYILNLSDFYGCTANDTITLVASEAINYTTILSTFGAYNLPCAGDSSGSATIIPSGGTPPYTVIWDNGDSTGTQVNLSAGNYGGYIVDSQNCIGLFSIDITEPGELSVDFEISSFSAQYQIQCNGDSSGFIYSQVTGGVPPYIFNWNGPLGFTSNSDSISTLIAGTYNLELSDQNTCIKNYSITLNEAPALTLDLNEINSQICNGDSTASILASSFGGVGSHSIIWSGPNGFSSTDFYIEGLSNGIYCAILSDENMCSTSACYEIISADPLSISLFSPETDGLNITCFGDSSGSIISTILGGIPPYEYSWSGPLGSTASGANPNNLIAGHYILLVTDSLGCVANASINLIEGIAIQSSFSTSDYNGFNLSCYASADAYIYISSSDGIEPYSYNCYNESLLISNNDSINNLDAGLYIVETIDSRSCLISDTIELLAPDSLVMTLISPEVYEGINISCANGNDGIIESLIVGGVEDYNYSWTGPGSYSSNEPNINMLLAGTYTLTITDENMCSLIDSLLLIDPDEELNISNVPSIQNSGTNISCFNGSDGAISLEINGGIPAYQIYWLGPEGFSSNEDSIVDLLAGVYFLSVVDSASCTYSEEIILTQPADSLNYQSSITENTCFGDSIASIQIDANGASPSYEITWQGPDGYSSNDFLINILGNGEYIFSLTDTNLCMISDTIAISSAEEMQTTAALQNLDCYDIDDGSIALSTTGGGNNYTFNWTGPNSFTSDSDSIANLEFGEYCVVVSSDLNCVLDTCFTLSTSDSLIVDESLTHPNCGYPNGAISLNVSGGTSPYVLDWGFALGNEVDSLLAGQYSVEILDSLNCNYQFNYELIGPDSLLSNAVAIDPLCPDSSYGNILVSISGGSPEYEVLWIGPNGFTSNSESIDNLAEGNYQLSIVDSLGCSLFEEYSILSPDSISFTFFKEVYDNGFNVSEYGFNDGLIELLSIDGGSGSYTIQWHGPSEFESNELTISQLYAGMYDLSIMDANNCLLIDSIFLSEPNSTLIPTGFTPNNDGFNDHFIIPGNSSNIQVSIKVFNRWGNIVYENTNYENDWDGSNKDGQALPEGTYFVIVEIEELEQSLNGYVDLRR